VLFLHPLPSIFGLKLKRENASEPFYPCLLCDLPSHTPPFQGLINNRSSIYEIPALWARFFTFCFTEVKISYVLYGGMERTGRGEVPWSP